MAWVTEATQGSLAWWHKTHTGSHKLRRLSVQGLFMWYSMSDACKYTQRQWHDSRETNTAAQACIALSRKVISHLLQIMLFQMCRQSQSLDSNSENLKLVLLPLRGLKSLCTLIMSVLILKQNEGKDWSDHSSIPVSTWLIASVVFVERDYFHFLQAFRFLSSFLKPIIENSTMPKGK